MKVLFWRTEFYGGITVGGTASLHNGKINGFLKLGHQCAYASSGPMALPPEVSYHYIPYNKFFRNFPEVLHFPYNQYSIKRFEDIIKLEKPDFIYQQHHISNWGGAKVKKDLGIPFILHVDGVEYWSKKNWGKMYFSSLIKWAEEIQVGAADAIVTPSQVLKDQLLHYYDINPDKIFPAPNGVDPDKFHPGIDGNSIRKQLGISQKFVCGFTGTFGHWHGLEVLAKAVKHIVHLIPDAVVLFVGDGNLRHKIEEIMKHDNVFDHAIITGFKPYNEIPSYLAACDVLLTPCVNNPDSEFFNSPVKLFEYMAMQKPIIATSVGQQRDIFVDRTNAIVIPEQDPEALADAVFTVYKEKELSELIAKNARQDAIDKYDWKNNAQIIIDAYHWSLSQKTNGIK